MGAEQYTDCLIKYNNRIAVITGARSNYDGEWINMRFLDGGGIFSVSIFERDLMRSLPDPKNGLLKSRDGKVIFEYLGEEYELTDQPYEPCLYIKKDGKIFRTLHNAFTADGLPERFAGGEVLTGIDGKEYDLGLFCRVLAAATEGDRSETDFSFAAGLVNKAPEDKK